MKLQTKLLLNLFFAIFIAFLILVYVIVRMIDLQSTASSFSDSLLKVERLNSAMVSYQQSLDNFGKSPTEGNLVNAKSKYNDVLEKAVPLHELELMNEEKEKRIAFILNKIETIKQDMEAVIEEQETVRAIMLSSKIYGVLNDIYLLNYSMNEEYDNLAKKNNAEIVSITIMSSFILLVVSSTVSVVMTRRIVRPIIALSNYSEKISSGNLSIKEIEVKSKDEVGQLTKSFNTMKENLRELITRLNKNANELKEKNERINDSILYAKRIQNSFLPNERELAELFDHYFLLSKQRDTVGGDFYWSKRHGDGFFVAVADCTGHGVPGALMTSLSISALNQIIEEQHDQHHSPAAILNRLNQKIKRNLNQETKTGLTDDGLDIGLCYIEKKRITYAGAKLSLYIQQAGEWKEIKGDRKSIGYRRTPIDYSFTDQAIEALPEMTFYITTDGYLDQNGGEKDLSFGKKKFIELMEKGEGQPLAIQKELFQQELKQFMGSEAQRDDITVLAFQL